MSLLLLFPSAGGGATDLVVADVTSASTIDNVALTQAHTLTVNGSTSGSTVDALTLTQAHTLSVADASSGSTIDGLTLDVSSTLAVNDSTAASTIDAVTLPQAHTLAVAGNTSGSTVDGLTITQAHTLTVNGSTSSTTIDALTLTQAHSLTVADSASGSTIDGVILSAAGELVVNGSTSSSTIDAVTLTQVHGLAVADVSAASTVDAVTLTQAHALAVADSTSASTIDNVALTQAHTLVVLDLVSASTIDGITLVSSTAVVPWLHGMRPFNVQAGGVLVRFAVLHVPFGRITFRIYDFAPDAEDRELVEKAARTFWHVHVLTGTPPPADAHQATTEAIRARYDLTDPDDILFADPATSGFCHLLRAAKDDLAHAKAKVTELENTIKARMADCAVLSDGDRVLATWKAQDDTRLDVDRLRTERPELWAEYARTKTIRKFLLKTPKD